MVMNKIQFELRTVNIDLRVNERDTKVHLNVRWDKLVGPRGGGEQ